MTEGRAADLIAAIRRITTSPSAVVNTHAHWDHCFGKPAFRPAEIWGHRAAAVGLEMSAERQPGPAVLLARDLERDDIDEQTTRVAVQRGWLRLRG